NFQTYDKDVETAITKYFPSNSVSSIVNILEDSSQNADQIKSKAALLALELEGVSVPRSFVTLHRYTIAVFRLMPIVVTPPSSEELKDMTNVDANAWYDNAQAFLAATQQLNFEAQKLAKK